MAVGGHTESDRQPARPILATLSRNHEADTASIRKDEIVTVLSCSMSGRPLPRRGSYWAQFVNLSDAWRCQVRRTERAKVLFAAGGVILASLLGLAQTRGVKEDFTAVAIVNNDIASGAGRVLIRITRWSTKAESDRLVGVLRDRGANALLRELRKQRPVGTIRTPDSLAYDLRYASEQPGEDGGREIVIATDRPIGFWEARNQPRTIDYPFTVIQMQMNREGRGKGTLSYATKIAAIGNVIQLENFASAPVMLTEIQSRPHSD